MADITVYDDCPHCARTNGTKFRHCEKCRARQRRYKASDKGRASERRHNASDKGRARNRHYEATEKGRARNRHYEATEKGRATRRRYDYSRLFTRNRKFNPFPGINALRGIDMFNRAVGYNLISSTGVIQI